MPVSRQRLLLGLATTALIGAAFAAPLSRAQGGSKSFPSIASSLPGETQVPRAVQSWMSTIVRVVASREGSASRIATGFLAGKGDAWRGNAVAAPWHVVAGATDVAVEKAGIPRCSARVIAINPKSDAVLLELDRVIEVDTDLRSFSGRFENEERLWTLGYPDVEEPNLESFCAKAGADLPAGHPVPLPRLSEIVEERK